MTQEEAFNRLKESYDQCSGGRWMNETQTAFEMLEGYALTVMELAQSSKWKEARRWLHRLIDMEKRYGFENTPIWGEFGETFESIFREINQDSAIESERAT